MIQLTRKGLATTDPSEVASHADTFARVHRVKTERFVEPRLLHWMASAIARATFVPRVHDDVDRLAPDLRLSDHVDSRAIPD